MTRWVLVAVGVIGLLVFGALYRLSPSAKAEAEAPAALGFSGKPVVVQAKDNVSCVLEKAEVRHLGGRAFIVGRAMKDSPYHVITGKQFGGSTVWVPVDAVTRLLELGPPKQDK